MRAVIKFFFLQGKAPKEIHAILPETLACFLSGWAKDLSAPLHKYTQYLKATEKPHYCYHHIMMAASKVQSAQ
jgi:hypothetical protein